MKTTTKIRILEFETKMLWNRSDDFFHNVVCTDESMEQLRAALKLGSKLLTLTGFVLVTILFFLYQNALKASKYVEDLLTGLINWVNNPINRGFEGVINRINNEFQGIINPVNRVNKGVNRQSEVVNNEVNRESEEPNPSINSVNNQEAVGELTAVEVIKSVIEPRKFSIKEEPNPLTVDISGPNPVIMPEEDGLMPPAEQTRKKRAASKSCFEPVTTIEIDYPQA
jgi:hypothetical protein